MSIRPFFGRESVLTVMTKQQCIHVFYQSIVPPVSWRDDQQIDVIGGISISRQSENVDGHKRIQFFKLFDVGHF